jgi:hypothetical protein
MSTNPKNIKNYFFKKIYPITKLGLRLMMSRDNHKLINNSTQKLLVSRDMYCFLTIILYLNCQLVIYETLILFANAHDFSPFGNDYVNLALSINWAIFLFFISFT